MRKEILFIPRGCKKLEIGIRALRLPAQLIKVFSEEDGRSWKNGKEQVFLVHFELVKTLKSFFFIQYNVMFQRGENLDSRLSSCQGIVSIHKVYCMDKINHILFHSDNQLIYKLFHCRLNMCVWWLRRPTFNH